MKTNINQLDVMKSICQGSSHNGHNYADDYLAFANYSNIMQLESKNKVTNILLRRIPEILNYYIKLQRVFEGAKPNHRLYAQHRSLAKKVVSSTFTAFANDPHDYFSQDANMRELLDSINLNTTQNNYMGSRTIFNGPQASNCSNLIETCIKLYHDHSALAITGRIEDKLMDIMHYTEDQQVSYALLRYLYDNGNNKHYTKYFKTYNPLLHTRERYTDAFNLMEFKYNNLNDFKHMNDILMIMINLYLIAERITTDHDVENGTYLNTQHMSDSLRPALVIGAYEAGSLLFEAFLSNGNAPRSIKAKSLSNFCVASDRNNAFPTFVDFTMLLYKFIIADLVTVVCNSCNNHYIELANLLDTSYSNQYFGLGLFCPKCGKDVSYYLEDHREKLKRKKMASNDKAMLSDQADSKQDFLIADEKKEAP